ncbi:phospholipase A1-like isoform X1 [Formica exsecta]|uniref:phospholipase A1-like isoform X1 n=1 Tax=Formica exsecta TaxID=72781 RepID=UPI0011444622|nr:phospholipase A1-like isoform X1 [Formica exsecta]
MRTVAAILITFLVRCVYLHPMYESGVSEDIGEFFNSSCIFGPKSMSMILFNSNNPEGKDIGEKESCKYIDPSRPIVFLVHGFTSSGNNTNNYDLALQLVEKDYTVFSLDWSAAACTDGIPIIKLLEYPAAVKNTREIGELMAKYVITLITDCKIPLDNITFVGHSLGAHVCGFAAKNIHNLGYGKMPLIIGADPAAPLFGWNKCENRLCKTDAIHVIIVHTSLLGMQSNMGDVDLRFNGGKEQPNCAPLDLSCSHTRSMVYLFDIFNNCVYPADKIKSSFLGNLGSTPYPDPSTTNCVVVNDEIFNIKQNDTLRDGDYYVFVQKDSPYCTQKSFSCKSLIE